MPATSTSSLSCVAIDTLGEGVYSDTTQLNSTDPVEQRTANQREASQSCFCLWRHDLQTESTGLLRLFIAGDTVVHAVNVSTTRRRVELSWVAINGP